MTLPRTRHEALYERARRVIPGGVYGHAALAPSEHPRFFSRGDGCRVFDVDGNEYIDFMCGFGPNLLGMNHPEVEKAADEQRRLGDSFGAPTERMVELAELLVERIGHADWALFMKNGTDATTLCVTIARAASGRRKILLAKGAYHGAAPWCTPAHAGVLEEDRAHFLTYRYNDLASVEAAVAEAGDDLAGILVSPLKHDTFVDQEPVDPEFAQALRRICDEREAALLMDEVRTGFRLTNRGSWEALGVEPDLSAWGKAIANGYPLSAVLGGEKFRDAATQVYATGSFWYAAVPMAAALATLRIAERDGLVAHITAMGERLRAGLDAQARARGFALRQTGPPQMPQVLFEDDVKFEKGVYFTTEAMRRGVLLHPFHNMFLSGAHRTDDIDEALERTDEAMGTLV